ncbi:hypothetical protein GLOTRDRAFT_81366 [Gloeophyllum trabeum ATCC 11539]|uniref:UBR-type domain-containing protein n=1 Tax=Gloeophyllum trabeum (strain ATCC 11539 / FP-39264 / Madison 617) TaxID=670483 RepID=S7PTU7_GLOTA|nr:uncharacterized protein GLOTRDRAFT_81366 [Gloeophyllum trabeum ATCC 11539]EPQ51221.1 hypothetical protein GLOTRDRAFT_81366 [Gloeophyllum trabeum ATCC 11539]
MSDRAQTLTSQDLLASQTSLVSAAAEALPHAFTACTHPLGPVRQAIYLCLSCEPGKPKGVCAACSIACHADHEQLELFPKRTFRCDCPTRAFPASHRCTLHTAAEPINEGNRYGQNFRGVFCRCGRKYDVRRERETMIQCLACEDWFHESCLNLRERPPSREPSPVQEGEGDDDVSESESDGLPLPLLSEEDYDTLVCGACVREIPTLRRWAGTRGAMMVVRDADAQPWKAIGREDDADGREGKVEVQESEERETQTGEKRPREGDCDEGGSSKRLRASPSHACLAPPAHPTAQALFDSLDANLGAGDVFLTEGWRGRWCRCPSCLPSLEARPYLLEEEETYEPPEDPDSGLSLEELGMRALSRLPRERALDGIRAFNEMRDGLMSYLRPFAAEGRVVAEEDVRAFFEARGGEGAAR